MPPNCCRGIRGSISKKPASCCSRTPLPIAQHARGANRTEIAPLLYDTEESVDFSNVADNLRESFRVLAAGRKSGEVRELRGVSIASAGVTFQMFNAAFLASPVESDSDLEQRIQLASLHFQTRGQEWA